MRLRACSAAMAWARFCARVRLRLGIIAVRSPPGSQVVRGWPKRCRGGVGAIKLGNSRALPGVVMQLCPPGSRQITVPSGSCSSRQPQNVLSR